MGDEPPSAPPKTESPHHDDVEDQSGDVEYPGGDEGWPVLLRGGLEHAAGAGDNHALYVLALLMQAHDDDSSAPGSEHWYRMRQSGMRLVGVEAEWADAYAANKTSAAIAKYHLEQASDLGNPHALLDLAEQRGDADCFFQGCGNGC